MIDCLGKVISILMNFPSDELEKFILFKYCHRLIICSKKYGFTNKW